MRRIFYLNYMKTPYLFHHRYKKFGWILLSVGVLSGISYYIFELEELAFFQQNIFALLYDPSFFDRSRMFSIIDNNILDEIITLFIIIGGILVAFTKTKIEDEFISIKRMESLVLATYINYFILLLTILFIFDLPFFHVLVFNMFTLLIIFIIIFHYKLFKLNQSQSNEK